MGWLAGQPPPQWMGVSTLVQPPWNPAASSAQQAVMRAFIRRIHAASVCHMG